jgi:Arc/MetJ-type ribon-helix-helix transcriptional regulator
MQKQRKKKTVYIKPELCEWIEERIKKREFWNFSHAVERALQELKARDTL